MVSKERKRGSKWLWIKIILLILDVWGLLSYHPSNSNLDWDAAILISMVFIIVFFLWIKFISPEKIDRLSLESILVAPLFPFREYPIQLYFFIGIGCLLAGSCRLLVEIIKQEVADPLAGMFLLIGFGLVLITIFISYERNKRDKQRQL